MCELGAALSEARPITVRAANNNSTPKQHPVAKPEGKADAPRGSAGAAPKAVNLASAATVTDTASAASQREAQATSKPRLWFWFFILLMIPAGAVARVCYPMITHDPNHASVIADLRSVVNWRLDTALFVVMAMGSLMLASSWLRRAASWSGLDRGVGAGAWLLTLLAIAGGSALAEFAAGFEHERARVKFQAMASTYAAELAHMGHASLSSTCARDDLRYLSMIDAENRWLASNPLVADIYTVRRDDTGDVTILVDSETDFDHDGTYEGVHERRLPPGQVYLDPPRSLLRACDGKTNFDDEPTLDHWGTKVTAYQPLLDSGGRVNAALGVDFQAGRYVVGLAFSRAAALSLAFVPVLLIIVGAVVRGESNVRGSNEARLTALNTKLERRVEERTAELKTAYDSLLREVEGKRHAHAEREELVTQVQEASRRAGMAEVATGILHNVGNVLNSVNVSANVIADSLRRSKVANLAKAGALMREQRNDLANFLGSDPKGKQIPDYLITLSDYLEKERATMLGEVEGLARNVDHIKQIVNMQQDYAKRGGVSEQVELAELVGDAIKVNATAGDTLEIVRDFKATPTVLADRHALLQILVNLISNARHAVNGSGREDKRIVVTLHSIDSADGERAFLQVRDNGVGISAENLPKVFNHGFTTKKDGHGFGLHSSANTAKQMGGSLTAHSDGPDMGAVFTLELPLGPRPEVAETASATAGAMAGAQEKVKS